MTEFEPVSQSPSFSVRIAEQIVARIQSGEFAVGTRLPSEAALARQFGVSRPTVREALGALQFVGHIESLRGSGSRVVSSSGHLDHSASTAPFLPAPALLQLFEARLLIEPQVAALAARDPDMDKLDEADGLIEGMQLVVNEPALHGDTDLRVHRALSEVCQNAFLRASALKLLDVVASPRLRATREQAWTNRVLPPIWGDQHRQIVEAIRERDAATAAEVTWKHLASSALNALTVIARDPDVDEITVDAFRALLDEGPFGPAVVLVARPTTKTAYRMKVTPTS